MRDKQEFHAIYEEHHAAVCAFFARRAARDDVEDLAAETFAIAWRKLPRRVEHPLPCLPRRLGRPLGDRRRATEAMAVPADSILYAKSHATRGSTDYGIREVWVYGDKRMRWLDSDTEEVYAEGQGTTRVQDGKRETDAGMRMVPNEIFRAGALVDAAKAAKGVELREEGDAYVLRWREASGPPHWPVIELTLWVDKDTYAPLRFTDHSWARMSRARPSTRPTRSASWSSRRSPPRRRTSPSSTCLRVSRAEAHSEHVRHADAIRPM